MRHWYCDQQLTNKRNGHQWKRDMEAKPQRKHEVEDEKDFKYFSK